jgi:hypothetical protein
MTTPTDRPSPATGETARIADEATTMLSRLRMRVDRAYMEDDAETLRWLHRRIVAIERDAQNRGAEDA